MYLYYFMLAAAGVLKALVANILLHTESISVFELRSRPSELSFHLKIDVYIN